MDTQARRRLPAKMSVSSWEAPDGWALRAFSQPAAADAAAGSLLFLGGRGDFFEKYLEAIDDWSQAGWSVAGFDWRGQGGSGRLHPEGCCHIDDFSVFIDDLAAFTAEWRRRSPGPHVAIGHSLGGHLLLKAVATERVELDGMVLLAPMLGIRAGLLGARAMSGIGLAGRLPPFRERAIWRAPRSPAPGWITSCPERQADKQWWKQAFPEIARGGPTWGWLAAATRSIAELHRLLATADIAVPGLLLTAADDPVVDNGAIRRALRRLPSFEHATIQNAGHEMLRERDGPRHEALGHIRAFLGRIASAAKLSPAASARAGALSQR